MRHLFDLISAWRERAGSLRAIAAAEGPSRAMEHCAKDLEEALERMGFEVLTLGDAETEAGYTRSHLRRLIRNGTIPNAGTSTDPKIFRRHLPKKPGYEVAHAVLYDASSPVQVACAVTPLEE